MEHITANNEAKWAPSFISYSQFVLHRKLVTDHSKHSLGSKVITPRISGWEVPLGSIHMFPNLFPLLHAKGAKEQSYCAVLQQEDHCQFPNSLGPCCTHDHGKASPPQTQGSKWAGKHKDTKLTEETGSQKKFQEAKSSSIKKPSSLGQSIS